METSTRRFFPGDVVSHFKRDFVTDEERRNNAYLYKIVGVARLVGDDDAEQDVMVYQALYGDFKTYARPMDMFMSEVDRNKYPQVEQKYRFEGLHEKAGLEYQSTSVPD